MIAVLKRELRAYFLSPLGYVYIAVMYMFTGYFFYVHNLLGATADMAYLFGQLFSIVLFTAPILTMRLLPEDRRTGVEKQLMSLPVRSGAVVAGKYFAAALVYAVAISGTLAVAALASLYGKVDWPTVVGSYAGLLLAGCALAAVCIFLSAFTESQFIAAVCGFGACLLLMLLDYASLRLGGGFAQDLLLYVSFNNRYSVFASGMFDIGGAVYFASAAALFVALASASLDRRRWG